jgi:hypothetical protein
MLSSEQLFNLLLTCAGGFVGLISGLATSICSKWLNSPRLHLTLEFDRIQGAQLPVFPLGTTEQGTAIEARYARLKIVNKGRKVTPSKVRNQAFCNLRRFKMRAAAT